MVWWRKVGLRLGPGDPDKATRARLEGLTVEKLFAPDKVRRQDCAAACLSGLWLYHDFLDESHSLSQALTTAEGSYWHGLMHRREPDFGNAAYWFRRWADTPSSTRSPPPPPNRPARSRIPSPPSWSRSGPGTHSPSSTCARPAIPAAVPTKCSAGRFDSASGNLFDYCYRKAVGEE